jgi:transcription elongation GreA/GreB family factor
MVCAPAEEDDFGRGCARLGSAVTVQDGELVERWQIVGPEDANVADCRMSEDAPMARALLGRRAGEVVMVRGPGGGRPVTVVAIEQAGVPW